MFAQEMNCTQLKHLTQKTGLDHRGVHWYNVKSNEYIAEIFQFTKTRCQDMTPLISK